MPLDPNIALSTRLPEMRSPLQTLGAITQLRSYQDLQEQRRLMNEERTRELEDDDAIRFSLSQSARPDDAITSLYHSGHGTAASKLSKNIYDYRKAQGDSIKQTLDNQHTALKLSTQILQGVKQAPPEMRQSAFSAAKSAVKSVLGDDLSASLNVDGQLGDEYDEKKLDQAIAWGTDRTDYLRQQQDAFDNAQKAIDTGLKIAKNVDDHLKARQEADQYWLKSAAQLLPTSRSQEDWDGFRTLLKEGGAPDSVLNRFDPKFTPQAVARAKTLAVTPYEAEQLKGASASRAETHRHNVAMETKEGGGAGGGLTKNQRAVAERDRADAFSSAEKAFRTELFNQGIQLQPGLKLTPDQQNVYNDALARLTDQKVQIQNSYRTQVGLPPLERAEYDAVTGGRDADVKKLRAEFRTLTGGGKTLLEQMDDLNKQIREAFQKKDFTKVRDLQAQLRPLRDRFAASVGR